MLSDNPIINLYYHNKTIYIPVGFELNRKAQCKINWIQEIRRPYFLAGITYCDNYPYDEGSNMWILELDKDEGLKPVCQPDELENLMKGDYELCETSLSTSQSQQVQ